MQGFMFMKYRAAHCVLAMLLLNNPVWAQENYAPDDSSVADAPSVNMVADEPSSPPTIDVIALYTMSGVTVDVTAASAAAAREQAIFDGQRTALAQLLEKLQASKGFDPAKLSDNKIAALVRSFEITSEKASAVRYIATMNVRFKPRSVASLLKSAGIQFLSTPQPPIVLLPLSMSGGKAVLWNMVTPWRQAVEALAKPDGLQPIIVPKADSSDVQLLDVLAAKAGDAGALGALATTYRAGTVWVAYALDDAALLKPKQKLKVLLKRYDAYGQKQDEQTLTVPPIIPPAVPVSAAATVAASSTATAPAIEAATAQWQAAALQLQNALRRATNIAAKSSSYSSAAASAAPRNDDMPNLTTPAMSQNNAMQLYAPLGSLPELTRLKQRLSTIGMISSLNVQTVRRDGADIGLAFTGTIEQLQQAVAAQGLSIQQNTSGLWQISSPQ
jgi:hypothetical protein